MRRFLLTLTALLIATVLFVVWVASQERVQDALGRFASQLASRALGKPVEIGWIAWEPLSGAISAGDLAILDQKGELLVAADYASAAIRWGASVPGIFDLREVTIYGLRTALHVDESGALHPLAELTAPVESQVALPEWLRALLPERRGSLVKVRVETARIEDASVSFSMAVPDMEARIADLDAVVEFDEDLPRSFRFQAAGGYYRILDWPYEDVHIEGYGGLRRDGLFFRDLDVTVGRPVIDAKASIDIPLGGNGQQPLVTIDAQAQLDLSLVNQHYTPIPTFLGTADAGVDIAVWPGRGIEMTGRLTADRMLMQGGLVSNLLVDLYLDQDHIEFPRIEAVLPPSGALSGTGVVNWHPEVNLAFAVRTTGVADAWGSAFGGDLPLAPAGRQSGATVFSMDFVQDWALHLRSSGQLALDSFALIPSGRTAAADVAYRMRLDAAPHYVRIQAPGITSSWFDATAEVTISTDAPAGAFVAAGTASVEHVEWLGLDSVAKIAGTGQGRWRATPDRIEVDADVAPLRLWMSQWDQAHALLSISERKLAISDLSARRRDGRVAGWLVDNGEALTGWFRLRGLELRDVLSLTDVAGVVDGAVELLWIYPQMTLPWMFGDLSLTGLAWQGVRSADLQARLRRSGDLVAGEVLGEGTALTIGGDIRHLLLTVDGRLNLSLPARVAELVAMDHLELEPHLRVAGPQMFAHLTARGGAHGEVGAVAFYDGRQMMGWLSGAGEHARGRATLRADERWTVGGELEVHLPGFWFDSLQQPGGRVRLLVGGTGNEWASVDGQAAIQDVSTIVGGVVLRQKGPARAEIRHGRLALTQPFDLGVGDQGDVILRGYLERTALGLDLSGGVPLDVLALEPVGVRLADGWLTTDVQLRGSWSEPAIYGNGRIEATRLALAGLDEPVEQMVGDLVFDGTHLRIMKATGRVGDGDVVVGGELGLIGTERGQLRGTLHIDSSALRVNERLQTGIAGELRIDGRVPDDLLLSGLVELAGLRYTDELTWERLLLQVGASRAPVPERQHGVRLALDVRGNRDLQIRTGLLNGGMQLRLRLLGTSIRPILDGVVELDRGNEFFFRGRIYRISRGTIQFLGDERNQPFLDIEAETEARYRGDQGEQVYRIRLLMFGPADQLNVRFESVPPLPEDDVLALLSLGILASDLRVDRVDGLELSSILLSQQISQIEREVQLLTGFDRIEIEPAYDNSRGSSSMQVTLEKRINDRLRLRLSTALDVNADQRVELGYSLLRGIDLSAGWDNRSGGSLGNFYVRPRVVVPLP